MWADFQDAGATFDLAGVLMMRWKKLTLGSQFNSFMGQFLHQDPKTRTR